MADHSTEFPVHKIALFFAYCLESDDVILKVLISSSSEAI